MKAFAAANAPTTRLLRWVRLSYLSPKTEGARVYKVDRLLRRRWWQSPKAQISGGLAACQRVEDNTFHLGYFAR